MKKEKSRIAVLLLAIPFIFSSCILDDMGIRGEGDVITQEIEITEATGFKVNGSFDVVIEQGPEQRIEAVGHQNIIDRLDINVRNKTAEIELKHGFYHDYELVIYITVPDLEFVNLNGSGDVELYSFNNLDQLELKINGSGDIKGKGTLFIDGEFEVSINGSGDANLDVMCDAFEFRQAGSGDLRIFGSTTDQDLRINGSGNIKAFDFESINCKVKIYGSGNAQIRAAETLDASIFGSGDIAYKDYPGINFNSAGSGNLRNAN